MPAAAGIGVVPDLSGELTALLTQIPRGRITTYGDLARALGDIRAARWVGEFLLDHPHSADCVCHRVVRVTGEVGRYIAGSVAAKAAKLEGESIALHGGRAVLAARFSADEFRCSAPLRALQALQVRIARRVRERPLATEPEMLCGLDVAYRADGTAVGAAVLLDAATLETVAEVTRRAPTMFPYIPGYLTFRELPVLLELWDELRKRAGRRTVCLIDGNGRLHARRAGVASVFGVLTGVPTIGVSKSLLCGSEEARAGDQDQERPVLDQGELLAVALRGPKSQRPIYVSVGHRIVLAEAVAIIRRSRRGHRLPEPTHRADRLSRTAKR